MSFTNNPWYYTNSNSQLIEKKIIECQNIVNKNNKRLLHDIFHIGPGISPRVPYQARQRSWRADMGRGLIPGTIWKISCHNLFRLRATFAM
jgi:hypothetical protein